MPEPTDPMTERLTRFTPNAPGLDRDAILFAAGRQSARSPRLWRAAAALLAIGEVATVIGMWPRSPQAAPAVSPPTVHTTPDVSFPPKSPTPDVWTAGSPPNVVLTEAKSNSGEFVSSGPILMVGSRSRFD